MLELKVSRCCKLNDQSQLSGLLFIGKSCESDEYIVIMIINDTLSSSYAATCRFFKVCADQFYQFLLFDFAKSMEKN